METRNYTIYAITTTIAEEVALVAVMLWLLPKLGINIPLWGLILVVAAWGGFSYILYRLSKNALGKKPMVPSPEVGCKGIAVTPLTPKGYIRIKGERWKALSTGETIHEGDEVIIVERKGLTFIVSTQVLPTFPDHKNPST